MTELQNIMWKIGADCQLTPHEKRVLAANTSMGWNTRGRIDEDSELRTRILETMPTGHGMRVKDIMERNPGLADRYSIQKLTQALHALCWTGAVCRTEKGTEEVQVEVFSHFEWTSATKYKKIYKTITIESKIAIFTKMI